MEFKKTNKNNKVSRAFGFNYSKAQHLVELVLFFPFLVGIIGILTEVAYGLNTGIELNSALNNAVTIASKNQRSEENCSYDIIESEIYENTHKVLRARKVPYADTLKVQIFEMEGFYITIGTYEYTYAFKLVNLFFPAIPEKFYFKNIVITNKALFLPNDYEIYDNDLISDFSGNSQTEESTGGEVETPQQP